MGLACRERFSVAQYASLAFLDVDVDNTGRNHVLVADGIHNRAIGNHRLKFLADGKLHQHPVAIGLDLHVRNLPDIHTADLHTCTRSKAQGLFKVTVELVLLGFDDSRVKKVVIKYERKNHDGNSAHYADQEAGHFHPVNLFNLLKSHCLRKNINRLYYQIVIKRKFMRKYGFF